MNLLAKIDLVQIARCQVYGFSLDAEQQAIVDAFNTVGKSLHKVAFSRDICDAVTIVEVTDAMQKQSTFMSPQLRCEVIYGETPTTQQRVEWRNPRSCTLEVYDG